MLRTESVYLLIMDVTLQNGSEGYLHVVIKKRAGGVGCVCGSNDKPRVWLGSIYFLTNMWRWSSW